MATPVDVNVPMRQVFGHVLRIDDPLLGDNPKVAALRATQSDSKLKQIVNDALEKFFFPPKVDSETAIEEITESHKPEQKTEADETALWVSLFKMIVETLRMKFLKKV